MKLPTTNYRLPTVAKSNKGFTLIEVAVSVFVLVLGTMTIVGVMANSLKIINVASQTTIAANLSQEGIEVVRNIRDTNWVEGDPYDTGIATGNYCVNYDSETLGSCASNQMYWDGLSYNHDGAGRLTDFIRTINISSQTDSEDIGYIRVISTVNWDNFNVTTETHLYDWK